MEKITTLSFKETFYQESLNTLKKYINEKPNKYFSIIQKSIKEGNKDNINLLLSLPNISFKTIHPAKKSYNIFHFLSENNAPIEFFIFVEKELKKQKVSVHDLLNQMDNKDNTPFVLLMRQKELNSASLSFIANKLPHQEIKDTQAQILVNSFISLFKNYKNNLSFIHEIVSILDKIDFKITKDIINTSISFGDIKPILVDLYNMEGNGLKFISEMLQLSHKNTIRDTLKSIIGFLLDNNISYTEPVYIDKAIQNNETAFKKLIKPYINTPGFPYLSLIKTTIGKNYFEDFLNEPQILSSLKKDPFILQNLFCEPSFYQYVFSHLYDQKNEGAFLFKNINSLLDVFSQEYMQDISSEGDNNFLQKFERLRYVYGLEPLFSLFLAKGLKYSNSSLISDEHSFIPSFFCSNYTEISEKYMSLLPHTICEKFEKTENNKFKLKNKWFKENVFNLKITAFQSIINYKEFEKDSLFNEFLFNELKDSFSLFHDNYDIHSQKGLNKLLNELVLDEQKILIKSNYSEQYSYQNSYKNILSIYKELKENCKVEHELLIKTILDFFCNIAKKDFIIDTEHKKIKNEIYNKLKSEFSEMERNSIIKSVSSDSPKLSINKKRI